MNYTESLHFVSGLTDLEKSTALLYSPANYDLRRMELLLGRLDNPHLGRKTVHIAGTKGKGSTAAMIASILSEAGYRTGLFTSPHLHSFRERIKVDCRDISEEDFARITTILEAHVSSINEEAAFGRLTTFEVLTALAFLYFKSQDAAFQVIETGLGGRLDSTNVVSPQVCVLTSISFDHMQVLGNTLRQISTEKTGIIKAGCTVISAPQKREAASVIRQKCHDVGAALIQLPKDIKWKRTSFNLTGQCLTVRGRLDTYDIVIHLLGGHQLENTSLAIAAVEALTGSGVSIPRDAILKGLESLHWPARLQILHTSPLVVIDGAHNVDSINKLISSVKTYFKYNRIFVIFGASSDKDIAGMAKALSKFTRFITVTSSGNVRAADVESLSGVFDRQKVTVAIEMKVGDAIKNLLRGAGSGDMILITGSLYLAAEAEDEFNRILGMRFQDLRFDG